MPDLLLLILIGLISLSVIFQLLLWMRGANDSQSAAAIQERLENVANQGDRVFKGEVIQLRQEITSQQQAHRQELAQGMEQIRQSIEQRFDNFSTETNQKIELLRSSLTESSGQLKTQIGQELDLLRKSLTQTAHQGREETTAALARVNDQVSKDLSELHTSQKHQLEEVRKTVDTRLSTINENNEKRLEQMRQTVDEKLQTTLDTRLGESFKLVSERLELVHKGLGEMQSLASGVGDLKKVLTNVKIRGTWGEVQLGALLEQLLAPDQFEKNVSTTGSQERVEYAIKLPGKQPEEHCWLPVDAKFPMEDYQRLVEASERSDSEAVELAARRLETTLKHCAKTISEKYVSPPATTDFGILFLPTEGLYAEALRRDGLAESIQRQYRVILTGPNTFAAILNSLQMGFRTLAIQHRSSEVWEVLEAVKTEFGKYASILTKVKKKLQEASNTVERAETRTRVLQRHLRDVNDSASTVATEILGLPPVDPEEVDVPVGASNGESS